MSQLASSRSRKGWQCFAPIDGHYWYVAGVLGPHLGAVLGCFAYAATITRHYVDDDDEEQSALVSKRASC